MSYKHSILADNPMSFYLLDEVPSSTFLSYTEIIQQYATYQEVLDNFTSYNQLSGLPITDYSGNAHDGVALAASSKEVMPLVSSSIRGTEVLSDTQINLRFHNIANKYYSKIGFSIEAWVKVRSPRSEYLNIVGDPEHNIGIFYQNGDIIFRLHDNELRHKISYRKAHHVVATYTPTSMSLYVDKMQVASMSISNFKFTNESSAFSIGPAELYESFVIDSVACYRYPLTEAQIVAHNSAGLKDIKYKEILSQLNAKSFTLYRSKISPRLAYSYPSVTPWTEVIDDNNILSEDQRQIRFEKTSESLAKQVSFIDNFYIQDSYSIVTSHLTYDSDVDNVLIEFSLDGETGWETAKNNFPIPFFNKNDGITSGALFMRVTLSSEDTSVELPVLNSIELLFYSKKDFYGDNSSLKAYSAYDYGMSDYNYSVLSHDEYNGLRMYDGKGFNVQSPTLAKAIELIFTPVLGGTVLFSNGSKFYKWNAIGVISNSGIDSIYVNGIDQTNCEDSNLFLTIGSPHHIVINLTSDAVGDIVFNSSLDGSESGRENTYSNINIYEEALSEQDITSNYRLYTDRVYYSVDDSGLSISESGQGSDNTGYFVNETVWSSSSI